MRSAMQSAIPEKILENKIDFNYKFETSRFLIDG